MVNAVKPASGKVILILSWRVLLYIGNAPEKMLGIVESNLVDRHVSCGVRIEIREKDDFFAHILNGKLQNL